MPPAPTVFAASATTPVGIRIRSWTAAAWSINWRTRRCGPGAQVLASRGLVYENVVYFPQLSELVDFANAVPDLTIVSNHIGGLIRVGPYGNRDDEVMPAWREGVAALAQCPNVVMKLGRRGAAALRVSTGTPAPRPSAPSNWRRRWGPLITYCIDQFGPDRCLFESNFPPDKVSFSYNVMYNAFKRMTTGYSAGERAAMFHDNAARILPDRGVGVIRPTAGRLNVPMS